MVRRCMGLTVLITLLTLAFTAVKMYAGSLPVTPARFALQNTPEAQKAQVGTCQCGF